MFDEDILIYKSLFTLLPDGTLTVGIWLVTFRRSGKPVTQSVLKT